MSYAFGTYGTSARQKRHGGVEEDGQRPHKRRRRGGEEDGQRRHRRRGDDEIVALLEEPAPWQLSAAPFTVTFDSFRGSGPRVVRWKGGSSHLGAGKRRQYGKVYDWKRRGFGFIEPQDGGQDVFCHRSYLLVTC
jgi:hypothetical protein